jgi:hypothetical protein
MGLGKAGTEAWAKAGTGTGAVARAWDWTGQRPESPTPARQGPPNKGLTSTGFQSKVSFPNTDEKKFLESGIFITLQI